MRWYNIDMFQNEGVDLVTNLEEPLPFKDESVNFIELRHVLEHITNYVGLLMECYRVLKPAGTLHLAVPHASCRAAVADPTHVNMFVEETFFHFTSEFDFGFRTLQLPNLFRLAWLETRVHHRPPIDGGVPGKYFTEIIVDLDKPWDDEHIFLGEARL